MKSFAKRLVRLLIVTALFSVIFLACDDKKDDHVVEVTLQLTPDPPTVNTPITFLFEVEENGEHVDVTMFECEIEKAGSGNHQMMGLQAMGGEMGHYTGTWTFTETGNHEAHFSFMHDGEMEERTFDFTVN